MSEHNWNALAGATPGAVKDRALAILAHTGSPENICRFYDPSGNYAGTTFHALEPNDPFDLTPSDLLSISLMNVKVDASGVRRLLYQSDARTRILEALGAVSADATLESAREETLDAVAALYLEVRNALGGNKWVTASKIVARKRPSLFPVRDSVVCKELGLTMQYDTDLAAFRSLVCDSDVAQALDALAATAEGMGAPIALVPRLRLLDTAVWMHHWPAEANVVHSDDEGDGK